MLTTAFTLTFKLPRNLKWFVKKTKIKLKIKPGDIEIIYIRIKKNIMELVK
jgi:hypothetical protein